MKRKKKNNMVKEIVIMMLLSIIILLIMIVALYDFRPDNVIIPEIERYSSDSKTTSVKQEINYTNGGDVTADDSTIDSVMTSLKSYSIDTSDLTLYGQKNLYNSGNSNPFEYIQEEEGSEGSTETPATDGSTNNKAGQTTEGSSNNQSTGGSTTGTFFESKTSK